MRCRSSAWNLFHPQFHFPVFFLYIRSSYFQEHLRVFVIHFFYCNVSSKNLRYLYLCFFKKSNFLYLFPTNWLLLIVIEKLNLIERNIFIRNLSFLVPPSKLGENIYGVCVILKKGIFQISPASCLFYYCFDLLICIIDILEKPFLIA